MTTELAEATDSVFAETIASVFEEMVGTVCPESKGDAAVVWYLKALQRLDKQAADIRAAHQAEVNQSVIHAASRLGLIDRQRLWLDEQMLPTVEHVTRQKIKHSGKKSFAWAGGTCSLKKQQDQYDWPDDPTELLRWCETGPVPRKVTYSLDKAAIKKHIKSTGEIPPGVTVTPGKDQFYVKPAPLALPSEQPKLPKAEEREEPWEITEKGKKLLGKNG